MTHRKLDRFKAVKKTITGILVFLFVIIFLLSTASFRNYFGANTVHFIKNNNLCRVSRHFASHEDPYRQVFVQLSAGPTFWEHLFGIDTAIPPQMQLIAVNVNGDTVLLDFVDDIEQWRGSAHEVRLAIAQIVYSYTEFPEIKKVAFFVDGKEKELVLGMDGFVINKPLSRVDINSINKE